MEIKGDLREFTNSFLKKNGISKKELAEIIDVSRPLVSRYLDKKYESNPKTIETALRKYFESIDEEEEEKEMKAEELLQEKQEEVIVTNKSNKVVEFFESTDAVNIIAACSLCQKYMGLGVVVGRSGYGKTYTLKQYSKRNKVCYLECDDSMTCRDMIEAIEEVVGVPKGSGTIWNRVKHIIDFFDINEGYLLIIDEADKLMTKYSAKKMEILRSIFDKCKAGLIIAGEPNLENMLKAYLPRFANRTDYYVKLKGLSNVEIEKYLDTLNITEEALKILEHRGNNSQTGCFRLLNRTIKNLMRVIESSNVEQITSKEIKLASNMMML